MVLSSRWGPIRLDGSNDGTPNTHLDRTALEPRRCCSARDSLRAQPDSLAHHRGARRPPHRCRPPGERPLAGRPSREFRRRVRCLRLPRDRIRRLSAATPRSFHRLLAPAHNYSSGLVSSSSAPRAANSAIISARRSLPSTAAVPVCAPDHTVAIAAIRFTRPCDGSDSVPPALSSP